MKRFFLFLSLLLFVHVSNAQYKYDTVVTKPVGQGMVFTKYNTPAVPWTMFVLEVDLKNPNNKIETIKGKDNLIGREALSSMVKRSSTTGHKVIGAINADFFDMNNGMPINIQVAGGHILRSPISLSTIGFDAKNKPMLARVTMSGSVITKNGINNINDINDVRQTNFMVLYNKFIGPNTGTNPYGSEVLLNPIDEWSVNDTIRCVVASKVANVGNMAFNSNQVVLSGHGTSQTFITNNISVGDTIKIVTKLTPGIPKLKEMLGGYPKIVANGKNYADQGYKDEGGPDHAYNREPRTAIGYSKDSTKLYLVIADGRSTVSAGMKLTELADFMIAIGVSEGMNFDGGGSSEMIVRDAIMNVPSDGGERPVANALLVVSTVSGQGSLKSITLSPTSLKIFKGNTKKFTIEALDEYYNSVAVDYGKVTFTADPSAGTITSDGTFTAAKTAGSGYVYAVYNGFKDSVKVTVKTLSSINVQPKSGVIDNTSPLNFRLRMYDSDKIEYFLGKNEFNWKVTNPEIGSVDTMGVFTGKKEGKTKVIVSYEGLADTADVTVQISTGLKLLENFENLSSWTYSGENVDNTASKLSISTSESSLGNSSIKVDYKFTYDPSKLNIIYLNGDIPLYGTPDSIKIDGKSDGQKHFIGYLISDENEETYNLNTNKYLELTTAFDTLRASMARVSPTGNGYFFNFPARIKQIKVKLGCPRVSGTTYTGTLYLDNLRITYPSLLTGISEERNIPLTFNLGQNYPNPFNPTTTIEFSTSKEGYAELKIYDVLGREMESLVKGNLSKGSHKVIWDASKCTSGVYFYELKLNEQKSIKKMILVR